MIRAIASLLLATGLTGMGLGATRLAIEHFGPHVAYSAGISERIYHADAACPLRAKDQPILPLPTIDDAERFGNPCPHCVGGK